MQQYRDIKARHPQTILFFRMGDFYEMFEDDAKLAARELGLTLTARNNGGSAEVPLAGVPVKAATEYLRRVIAKGHPAAICEPVEDPKLAHGVGGREGVDAGSAEVPLAGVPVKAATEYLRRLIAKGHRVAICEQVEDPKLAKGVVRREVVETISPGAVLADDWLERSRNNFLVALAPGARTGLA